MPALDPLRTQCRCATLGANVQCTATKSVCTATLSLLTAFGGNDSLPPETVFVLVFAKGLFRHLPLLWDVP